METLALFQIENKADRKENLKYESSIELVNIIFFYGINSARILNGFSLSIKKTHPWDSWDQQVAEKTLVDIILGLLKPKKERSWLTGSI
jgi:hypothetical protein